MPINEIILGSGGGILLLLTLIQIAPIKINPWSWIANSVGKSINGSLLEKIDNIESKLNDVSQEMTNLDTKMTNMSDNVSNLDDKLVNIKGKVDELENDVCYSEKKCEERTIILCRARILRFGDELLHGIKHSKDHFDQILLDCTNYEHYCRDHEDFQNNITEQTINVIKDTYRTCIEEHSFL